jgi:hypothetical protein
VASEYAASEAVKDLQKTFEGLPKEQVAKLIDIDRRRIVESAAGLPQKTTVERVLKNLSNSALTKKEYEEIVGRMSKEMKETPLEIVGRIMDEGQKVSTTGQVGQLIQEGFEPLNLEQVFGTKAYNLIKEQWEEAKNYTGVWDELAQEIGYKRGVVETLDDVKAFKEAIENSNLDKASKEYYTKFVANTMEENIKNLPHREALGLGSFDAGYVPHVFNMEQAKELPDEGLFKRNLVDTKNRTFSTGVDVAMFNKYSPYKLE